MQLPLKKLEAHQRINATSRKVEYYSPAFIISAARQTMGGIDLDPFSCANANKVVRATRFFTKKENGLRQKWFGRVWMNHPFLQELNDACIFKLLSSYVRGDIKCACCITYASTSEEWFQMLADYPQCFLSPRTNYRLPNGTIKKGVSKGSAVTYLGPDLKAFVRAFSPFGKIKVIASVYGL